MTKKEKLLDFYKRVMHTEEEPSSIDLARFVCILVQCERVDPIGARKELEPDMWELLHKHTKVGMGEIDIRISDLLEEIGWYDDIKEEI